MGHQRREQGEQRWHEGRQGVLDGEVGDISADGNW